MRVLLFLIGLMLSTLWVLPANAKTLVYEYVDNYGILSFTNMEDRIPKAYVERAKSYEVDGLDSYEKYTPLVSKK